MTSIPRIMLTAGEPAGIGPDIILQIAMMDFAADLIVVSDPELLQARAKQCGIPIKIKEVDINASYEKHQKGILKIFPIHLKIPCTPGILNVENAQFVLDTLTIATDACLQKKADALVTGPINKSIMNDAGIPFTGHTEFLKIHTKSEKVIMLFVVDELKVALQTVHLPLAQVPSAISKSNIIDTIRLLHEELQKLFAIKNPCISVAGLNPHAGESGYLGREEIEIIQPAIDVLRAENINVLGPLPADTIFTKKHLAQCDAVLSMYHDQALPVVKYLGFDRAVNVTLGLPIIRTSVDHGTALDIAGTKAANASSLRHAIELAIQIHHHSRASERST